MRQQGEASAGKRLDPRKIIRRERLLGVLYFSSIHSLPNLDLAASPLGADRDHEREVACAECDMTVGKERRGEGGGLRVANLGQYGEAAACAYSTCWSAVDCGALVCQRCWACAPEYHHLERVRLTDVRVCEALCQLLVVQCLTWGQRDNRRCQCEWGSICSVDRVDLYLGIDGCAGIGVRHTELPCLLEVVPGEC